MASLGGWASLKWAGPVALAVAAGAGSLGLSATPAWTTGGRGPVPSERQPSMMDVVPSRAQQLGKLREFDATHPADVLIIGGGATGTGCAVDAATRGLRTVLVEAHDFASGTSSKSTKLVHGGVRYLEKAVFQADVAQLKLVYEALHERATLLRNASHLARPLPILTPCYKWWDVPYYWAGMKAYDLVAGRSTLVLSRYVGPAEAQTLLPTLADQLHGRSLKGAVCYYDGQFDDARLNVALACSAAAAGAVVLNYTPCVRLIKVEGQVVGAAVRDAVTGAEHAVHAKVVINATGPFLDGVRNLGGTERSPVLTASSGAHVTLPPYLGSTTTGIIIPKTSDGRVVFLLPWQGHLIAGTTDTECQVTEHPRSTEEEVGYILKTLAPYLGVTLSRSDVLSAWAGIRPLPSHPPPHNATVAVKDGDQQGAGVQGADLQGPGAGAPQGGTQGIVRDHIIFSDPDGLLNVSGGKWTTYRLMAEETIDAAVGTGRLPLNTGSCVTEHLPLWGSAHYHSTHLAQLAQEVIGRRGSLQGAPASLESPPPLPLVPSQPSPSPSQTQPQLQPEQQGGQQLDLANLQHLNDAYGDRARGVIALAEQQGLSSRLVPHLPHIEAEVVWACRNEYCVHVEDWVSRRSRIAFLDLPATLAALPRVAALMAAELGWSAEQQRVEEERAKAAVLQGFTAAA